jgi:hypothetical protein
MDSWYWLNRSSSVRRRLMVASRGRALQGSSAALYHYGTPVGGATSELVQGDDRGCGK